MTHFGVDHPYTKKAKDLMKSLYQRNLKEELLLVLKRNKLTQLNERCLKVMRALTRNLESKKKVQEEVYTKIHFQKKMENQAFCS
jgi:16S rRNA C1402 (ribose-2'-O) methylase RsmI